MSSSFFFLPPALPPSSVHEYRLSSWLGQQEDIHRIVLYQTGPTPPPSTQRRIRQADSTIPSGPGPQGTAGGEGGGGGGGGGGWEGGSREGGGA